MKNFIYGFILASLVFSSATYFVIRKDRPGAGVLKTMATKYHCPMHPKFIFDRPGSCPICGMTLVPIASSEHNTHSQPEAHLNESETHGEIVEGHAPVRLSAQYQQLMGIQTVTAQTIDLDQSIRTVGRVISDETRIHHVHTKFEGFVEHVYVNSIGQYVKQGEPLFSIYSPELLATQQEFLLALNSRDKYPDLYQKMSTEGADLVAAGRQRLKLWDIDENEIKRIDQSRQPVKALTIFSPFNGFVSAKMIAHGTKITPSEAAYDMIDLSAVWVLADIYEVNLPLVRIGQPAEISLSYLPGRTLQGHVSFIYPTLDPATRTAKVRLEFPNPGNFLKPEMYADVELKAGLGKALAVPEGAVLATGERSLVFVAKEKGVFEPREVLTGLKVRNFWEIRKGLQQGEQIVAEANFLLDSESKLRASAASPAEHRH